MSPGFRTALIFLLLLCLPEWVFAQRASVTGTVRDSTGAVVSGANVLTQNKATRISRCTLTSESGSFRLSSLAAGTYHAPIDKNGRKTVEYSAAQRAADRGQT